MKTMLFSLLLATSALAAAESLRVDGPACDSLKMQKLQLELTAEYVKCKYAGCRQDQINFYLAAFADIQKHHCPNIQGNFKVISRTPAPNPEVSIVEVKTPKGSRWILDY